MTRQVTILAAGMGTRLARPWPKPLTPLRDGRSIMAQQMDNIRRAFGAEARVVVVVGFKLELILEAFPDEVAAQHQPDAEPIEPVLVAELVDIVVGPEGPEARWDERQRDKQPDWGYGPDSGGAPADRIDQRDAAAPTGSA